jgi:hypothetical protein
MSSMPTGPLTYKTRPRHRLRRGGVLAAVFIAVSFCAAACGGGSGAHPSNASDSSPWSTARVIAYAKCMRAHGVPNYPEPSNGNSGTTIAGTGINMASSAFQSAKAKCYQLMPGGVPDTHATQQQITQALESAKCMRDRGFPNFPDPVVTSTLPTPPPGPPSAGSGTPGTTEYSNGILFKIPGSIDTSSPAFQAAAKVCNSPLYVPGGAPAADGAPS